MCSKEKEILVDHGEDGIRRSRNSKRHNALIGKEEKVPKGEMWYMVSIRPYIESRTHF
jgi:hypothetical protein